MKIKELFLDSIRKVFNQSKPIEPEEEKTSQYLNRTSANVLSDFSGGVQTTPTNMEDYGYAFLQNPWVYRSVYSIAQIAAGIPFKMYKKSVNKKTNDVVVDPILEHPALDVLHCPNPYMCESDFMEGIFVNLELFGNNFIEVNRFSNGMPQELYLIPPFKLKPVPDPKNYVSGYVLSVGERDKYTNKQIFFKPEEIIHMRYFNPMNEYYGLSPNQPVEQAVIIDQYVQTLNKKYFKNGAKLDAVLHTDTHLGETIWKRVREEFKQMYQGVDNAHKIAILDNGLQYQEIGAKDLDFPKYRDMLRNEIFGGRGLPQVMAGFTGEGTTFASSVIQRKIFFEDKLVPVLRKVESALNHFYVWRYYEKNNWNVYGKFDTSHLEALFDSEDRLSMILSRFVRFGIMTINQARARLGLPRSDNPMADDLFVFVGAGNSGPNTNVTPGVGNNGTSMRPGTRSFSYEELRNAAGRDITDADIDKIVEKLMHEQTQ